MITLYSYPELFGVADNNGYGLKVFAFFKLTGVAFTHRHIFDASAAPRGQLPYIIDDGEAIGDSDMIIEHLTRKYRLKIDDGLTAAQRACSTTSIGSCPIHAGRTSGFGRPSATRCAGNMQA
jgi:glutathione S-transferase